MSQRNAPRLRRGPSDWVLADNENSASLAHQDRLLALKLSRCEQHRLQLPKSGHAPDCAHANVLGAQARRRLSSPQSLYKLRDDLSLPQSRISRRPATACTSKTIDRWRPCTDESGDANSARRTRSGRQCAPLPRQTPPSSPTHAATVANVLHKALEVHDPGNKSPMKYAVARSATATGARKTSNSEAGSPQVTSVTRASDEPPPTMRARGRLYDLIVVSACRA